MPRQSQDQKPKGTDDFSDPELEQIQRYGQALGAGETEFDRAVEEHLMENEMAHTREASAAKMEAAKRGGAGPGLGPTEAEAALVKQRAQIEQRAAATGQAQAAQAQAAQPSLTPPPAPSGPAGVTKPYSSQAAAIGGPGVAEPEEEEAEEEGGEPPPPKQRG